MKRNDFFNLHARGESFKWAFEGVRDFFKSEPNALIHFVITVMAVSVGVILDIKDIEWVALLIVMGMVWAAELFNTAIEKTMDLLSPEKDPRVKFIKDISAGAVLIAAFVAILTGLIIFIPKI